MGTFILEHLLDLFFALFAFLFAMFWLSWARFVHRRPISWRFFHWMVTGESGLALAWIFTFFAAYFLFSPMPDVRPAGFGMLIAAAFSMHYYGIKTLIRRHRSFPSRR